ncbi:MAG: enoyl-CoA hydratase/isomerase family protein [Rhizobiaceae bacterium]|nr:enoyl-CoA hydratase/isomerase family protein [Rhizobiaceae bacterium]
MAVVAVEHRHGVAVLWMQRAPVNALGADLRAELSLALSRANDDPTVLGVVFASALSAFSAGADIKEFGKPPTSPTLRDLIEQMDASAKPLVAAVGGIALGGGFEIALACDARVVTPAANLGLPEVKIGLLPGAGGTQRLPRLIEPAKALAFIATGSPVAGEVAVPDGLADRLADPDCLIDAAVNEVKQFASHPRRKLAMAKTNADSRSAFEQAATTLLKRQPDEPQIEAIVDCVRATYDQTFEDGMKLEREHFTRLMADNRSKSLRYAFFAERSVGQLPATTMAQAETVKSVGIIGGGTMGSGIAMAFASAGIPVVLIETDPDAAQRAVDRIAANYTHSVNRGSISEEMRARNVGMIAPAVDYRELGNVDLVIEAAFEEMEIKREIFGKLVASTKPTAILATNTSYLSVDDIAAASGASGRVIGMHFFSPANIMKLVEVVRGAETSADAVATVLKAARGLGKVPVVVGNCHGFVGNRILARRSEQVDRLLLEGATPEQVDLALTKFGSKLGPCAMGDLAGLDISWRMRRATGRSAPVADALVEAGRLGQKSRKGYYLYGEDGRTPSVDPEALALIESVSRSRGIERRVIPQEEIIDRMILPMINEGARILEEGIADSAKDIDVIWLHGYGFPRWRGGPMFYGQTRGLFDVVARLKALAEATGDVSMRPTSLLESLAASGEAFS